MQEIGPEFSKTPAGFARLMVPILVAAEGKEYLKQLTSPRPKAHTVPIQRTCPLTQRKPDPTPIELFLAPLAALARKRPEIEALVFWGDATGWPANPSEALESEEITFYAEGLLEDGFHLVWTIAALEGAPDQPDHIRLCFWQDNGPAPLPLPRGWVTLESRRWTAAQDPGP